MKVVLLLLLPALVAGRLECTHSTALEPFYGPALKGSFLFYQANRAGKAGPDVRYDPTKSNDAQHWRKDCMTGDEYEGGWFDAGDHIKFTFTIAYSAATVAWGVLEFPGGYQKVGVMAMALDELEFAADYLMRTGGHNGDQVVMVGDGSDHNRWSACWNYPESNSKRPVSRGQYKDVLSETSSALTAVALVLKKYGTSAQMAKAAEYQTRAVTLFGKGKAAGHNTYGNGGFYGSDSYKDEQAWAAMWLHKAFPGQASYLSEAQGFYPGVGWGTLSWNNKGPAVAEMLCQAGVAKGCTDIGKLLEDWRTCGGVSCTPAGMPILDQWGAFRYSANSAFLALVHSQFADVKKYGDWATKIVNYILGENPRGTSYVVNVGPNAVLRAHHRSADDSSGSCTNKDPKHKLTGAMVGGATGDNNYPDNMCDYVTAEVAIDYNAGWTGAIAGINSCGDNGVDDCAGVDCGTHGTCKDYGWVGECVCDAGWGGANCGLEDTQDCFADTCKNGGQCQEGFRSYSCVCAAGYVGTNCEEVAPACPVESTTDSDCRSNAACCPTTHPVCYEKNQYWAGCLPRDSCDPNAVDPYDGLKWSCKKLGDRAATDAAPPPPTVVPPPPPPTCQTNLGENEGCKSSPECCASGLKCWRKNQWWAACMATCTPGWVDGYDSYAWECGDVKKAFAAEEDEQSTSAAGISGGAAAAIGIVAGLAGLAVGAIIAAVALRRKPATKPRSSAQIGLTEEQTLAEADGQIDEEL